MRECGYTPYACSVTPRTPAEPETSVSRFQNGFSGYQGKYPSAVGNTAARRLKSRHFQPLNRDLQPYFYRFPLAAFSLGSFTPCRYGCAGVAILGTVAAGVVGLAAHFAFLPGIMLTHNIRAQLPVCGQYRFPEVSAQQRIADCLHTYARVAVIQHKAAPAVVVGAKSAGQLFHLAILCFVQPDHLVCSIR